mmetsp:Transcript_40825/g.105581  ORF Transcript_40825/g.105581 Transcript_40825/m.105581 type:complete len:218 (+) Transcript_40825:139-792(+)
MMRMERRLRCRMERCCMQETTMPITASSRTVSRSVRHSAIRLMGVSRTSCASDCGSHSQMYLRKEACVGRHASRHRALRSRNDAGREPCSAAEPSEDAKAADSIIWLAALAPRYTTVAAAGGKYRRPVVRPARSARSWLSSSSSGASTKILTSSGPASRMLSMSARRKASAHERLPAAAAQLAQLAPPGPAPPPRRGIPAPEGRHMPGMLKPRASDS